MNSELPSILFDTYKVFKDAEQNVGGLLPDHVAAVLAVVVRHARNEPVPAAVPDEVTVSMVKNSSYAEGWNDCREAMLAAHAPAAVPDDVARDAARYRWLRKQNWNIGEICCVVSPSRAVKLGYDCPSGSRLDSIIDALLAAKSATKEGKP